MKLFSIAVCAILCVSIVAPAHAGDVYVKGYTRRDGTYVRPHVRSSPDSVRWNNYGPSRSSSELLAPRSRDYDRDGIANYLDRDDDNDAILDDTDSWQYGRDSWGNARPNAPLR